MPVRHTAPNNADTVGEMPPPNGMWVYIPYDGTNNSKSSQSLNPDYPAFPNPDGSVSSGWAGCNENAIGPPDWINYDCVDCTEEAFPDLPEAGGGG